MTRMLLYAASCIREEICRPVMTLDFRGQVQINMSMAMQHILRHHKDLSQCS